MIIVIGVHGNLFTVGAGLLSIHNVADGGSEADGCHVGIDVLLGDWVQGHYRAILP